MAVWGGSAVCVKKKRARLRTGAVGELPVRSYLLSLCPFNLLFIKYLLLCTGVLACTVIMTGGVCGQRHALPVFTEYIVHS